MAKRILFLITPANRSGRVDAVRSAGRIVRETGGIIRLAYITPLPPPRVDRHDRLVADTDREMERIAGGALEWLAALASELDGVPSEQVVRFGRLGAELPIEAEVFGADMIALAAPARRRLRESLQAWYVERAARAARVPLVILPPPAEGAGAGSGGALVVPVLR